MKSAAELAAEGRVGEAFDSILAREVPVSELALPPEELAKRGQVKEAYDAVLAAKPRIDWPRKGQTVDIKGPGGEVAVLKPAKTRGEFVLKYKGRVRWGTRSEIEEDVQKFQTTGVLPRSSGTPFAASEDKTAALCEAQSAFDKELKPYLMEMVQAAWKKVSHLMDEIDTDNWPDERLKYSVMRYKPLSHTEEQFTQSVMDAYIKWASKARPR